MLEPLVHPAYAALQSLQPQAYFGFDAKEFRTPRVQLRERSPEAFAAARRKALDKLVAHTRFVWMGYYLAASNQHSRYWYGLLNELRGGNDPARPLPIHPVPLYAGEVDYINCGGLHDPNRWSGKRWWPRTHSGVPSLSRNPSGDKGYADARQAEAEAKAEGFPDRTVIYLDVEFHSTPSPHMREYVAAFAAHFAARAREAGEGPRYRFGLYCGTAAVRYFVHALARAGVDRFPIWMVWWGNGQVVARTDGRRPPGARLWFEKRDWNWSAIEPSPVDRRSAAFAAYLDLHEQYAKAQSALVAELDALVSRNRLQEAEAKARAKQELLAYQFDPAFDEHRTSVEEQWVDDEDAFDSMDLIAARDARIVALQLPADDDHLSVPLDGLPVAKHPSGKLARLAWSDGSDIDVDVALCENPGLPPDP